MANILDWNIVVSFNSSWIITLTFRLMPKGKVCNSLSQPFPCIGQILSLLFFYKDGFGIKYPIKVDMPLNKETKSKLKGFFLAQTILSK